LTDNTHPNVYGRCFQILILILLFTGSAFAHGTKNKGLISPAEFADEGGEFQILDLRSQEDFSKAHIPSALSMPLKELSQNRLQALGITPDKQVVLYGVSESSGQKGKMLLNVLGYTKIRIVAGGFTHWVEDGQAVEAGFVQAAHTSIEDSEVQVKIIPESHNFGLIHKKNGIVSTIFIVRNMSASEITIKEITTSCGSTRAEIDADTLAPDGDRILL
jgi:rhodanese-related sulfurtransferase